MKRLFFSVFILMLLIVPLTGCGDRSPDMEGTVLDIDENGIELARNLSPDEYEKVKHMSPVTLHNEDVAGERDLGLIDLSYESDGEFKKGDEVEVWIDGDIMSSYPPQANAKKITQKE